MISIRKKSAQYVSLREPPLIILREIQCSESHFAEFWELDFKA